MGFRALLVTPLVLAVGCGSADPEQARVDWLRDTLVEDNWIYFEREPELSEMKLVKMAAGPYAFLRGTARQYDRDVAEPGGPVDARTAYGSPAASLVQILGDPHPENLGSYRTIDGTIIGELNDFDAATYGPYQVDLRRLAVGFWVGGAQLGLTDAERRAAAAEVAAGYGEEIDALVGGAAPVALDPDRDGAIVAHMFRKAAEDGDAGEKLAEYTRVVDGERVMFYGEIDPPAADGVLADATVELDAAEEVWARAVIDGYRATAVDLPRLGPAPLAIKGYARRLGAGVSSFPVLRYYVLLEGATTALDDDLLLELKETGDPYHFADLARFPSRVFADNGERAVVLQRRFQQRDDADGLLGWGHAGRLAMRVRERTAYQRNVAMDKIAEELAGGAWTVDDYLALAHVAGRLLARGHGLSPTATGEAGLDAIVTAIGGDYAGLGDETVAFAADYGPVVLADHQRLIQLLADYGPLLGYHR